MSNSVNGEDEALLSVFRNFSTFGMGSKISGPITMDSRQCQKLARDCGLIDKNLTKVDVDLIFTAVKGRGQQRIDYLDFLECLRQWSEKKGISYEEICDIVARSQGPTLNHVTTPDSHKFSTPLKDTHHTIPTATTSSISRRSPPSSTMASSGGKTRQQRPSSTGNPPPPSSSKKGELHPDWYAVENPDPQGPDEKVYYVNRYTNETTWDRPVLIKSVSSPSSSTLRSHDFDPHEHHDDEVDSSFHSSNSTSPHKSVFDKLTDPSLYTGMHKHRFDSSGQGLGIKGRDRTIKGFGTSIDSPSTFKGNTNTNSDEVFTDISQFIRRG